MVEVLERMTGVTDDIELSDIGFGDRHLPVKLTLW